MALHVHFFSFEILYQQAGYGQNMLQYGIYICICIKKEGCYVVVITVSKIYTYVVI